MGGEDSDGSLEAAVTRRRPSLLTQGTEHVCHKLDNTGPSLSLLARLVIPSHDRCIARHRGALKVKGERITKVRGSKVEPSRREHLVVRPRARPTILVELDEVLGRVQAAVVILVGAAPDDLVHMRQESCPRLGQGYA